jgi:large subunit ribosomal protein L25
MKSVPLTAFPRAVVRRAAVKRLRAAGRVPAVIYGRGRQPQNLELKTKALADLLHHSVGENVLLDLKVEGDAQPSRLALLQQVQHHPLTGRILHADLHEVAEDERVVITVPVETTGEAVGVKTGGGVLEHVLFRLKLRGLPKDLPEELVLDVSQLNVGQAIHIGDITPPPGAEILGDKTISVIAVAAPVTEAQEVAAEAGAAEAALGEPEVIKEKKEEGAAEAGKAPEKGAEKAPARAAERAPAKGAEKAPAKAGEKAAEKAPAKAPEKPPDKKAGRKK